MKIVFSWPTGMRREIELDDVAGRQLLAAVVKGPWLVTEGPDGPFLVNAQQLASVEVKK